MSTDVRASDESLADRVRAEIERAIKRNVKGVEYIASPAPVMGVTPRELVLKAGTLNLFHYRPVADEIYRVPVLIVMATTNKGYVLDLAPGQSFVEFLLARGYDVYMIDWNAPRPDEKRLRFEDYVLRFIPESVRRVQERSGERDVTVLGYCMGGVLSTMYAAAHPDDGIKNLVCLTTPVDFSQMQLFHKWSDRRFFDVDRLVDTLGNVPSDVLFRSFDMLRPASRPAGRIHLWDNLWNDEFVTSFRMFERWAADMLPLAGEYFRQTVKELMWDNALYRGTLVLDGKRVALANVKVPTFHVIAEHDHIVPYDAAKPLVALAGGDDKTEMVLKGGHISIAAGASASRRLWPKLDAWLGGRSL